MKLCVSFCFDRPALHPSIRPSVHLSICPPNQHIRPHRRPVPGRLLRDGLTSEKGMQTRKHKPTPWSSVFKHPLNNTPLLRPAMIDGDICCWVNTTLLKWSGSRSQAAKQYRGPGTEGNALCEDLYSYKGTFQLPPHHHHHRRLLLLLVASLHWKRHFQTEQPLISQLCTKQ